MANNFVESPDKNWLAYSGEGRNEPEMLVIQPADGQERFAYPVDYQEWDTIAYWLNNQTLVLWHHDSGLDNVILFNPFTGEKMKMGLDYPNIVPDDWEWRQSWPSVAIYAPSLQRLVYLAGRDPIDATLVLWDRDANRSIVEINNFGLILVIPFWKADESGLVYVKSDPGMNPSSQAEEVFFLSSDGKNKQITQLGDSFPHAIIQTYRWSPDERFLALNVQTASTIPAQKEQVERHLLILDMSSLELTDYCLMPEDFSPLIWSPDGRQLAFAEYLSDDKSRAVVIDLTKNSAFSVAEDLQPVGWLRSAK